MQWLIILYFLLICETSYACILTQNLCSKFLLFWEEFLNFINIDCLMIEQQPG